MASLGQIYQQADMPESTFTPIPAGWYMASVKESELKDTKAGDGKYINIQWEILGPAHEGRIIFDRINIQNNGPNKDTVIRIGLQQLGSIMRACGLPKVQNTDELIGVRCEIKVDIDKKPQAGYEPSNQIKDYRASTGGSIPAGIPRVSKAKSEPAQSAQDTGAAKMAPPWKKG